MVLHGDIDWHCIKKNSQLFKITVCIIRKRTIVIIATQLDIALK